MKKYLTIFLGLLLVILVWNSVTPANVNFPYNLLTMFLGETHTWTAKQTFNSGIGFSDGTTQTTAGGSGSSGGSGATTFAANDGTTAYSSQIGEAPGGIFISAGTGVSASAGGNTIYLTASGSVTSWIKAGVSEYPYNASVSAWIVDAKTSVNSQVTSYVQSQVSQYPYASQITSWFIDGTSTFGTGGGTPGGPPGSLQYNASGTLNGEATVTIDVKSGVTTLWIMVGGTSQYAYNWQGYSQVGYKGGVTDYVKHATTGTTRFWDNGTSVKTLEYNNAVTDYYYAGAIERLKEGSGVTQYDAAGNVMWGTLTGYVISEIEISSGVSAMGGVTAPYFFGNGSKLTGVATTVDLTKGDKARTGVSGSSHNQLSGTSISADQYGTVVYHNSASQLVYGLHPISSGATEYIKFVDMAGTGLTIYSALSEQVFQGTAGSATSAICIPPRNPRHYVNLFAVTGYVTGGVSAWWNFEGSAAVSRWN